MKKNTLFVLITFFFISCTNDIGTDEQENPNEQTPEVLNDERQINISSYKRGYNTDIIQELFDEAVENDKNLEKVTLKLEQVKELKYDSLEAYKIYTQNNQNYLNALIRYSDQLSDSTLKKDMFELVEALKDKQSIRTSSLDKLVADIDSTGRTLGDMEILMKIIVTVPMMNNYQRNKLPNLQTLELVKQALDSSINVVEPYTKILK